MACAPGAALPYCSRTTGVIPLSNAWRFASFSLAIRPAFGLLFSANLGLHDVNVRTVSKSDAIRGRLAVRHDLVRNQHGLFRGCCEASLLGKLGQETPDSIMLSGVQAFSEARCVSATWV